MIGALAILQLFRDTTAERSGRELVDNCRCLRATGMLSRDSGGSYEIAACSSNTCDHDHCARRLGFREGCTARSLGTNCFLPQAPACGPECRRADDQPRLPWAWVADRDSDGGIRRLVVGVVSNPGLPFEADPCLCVGPRWTRLQQFKFRAAGHDSRN